MVSTPGQRTHGEDVSCQAAANSIEEDRPSARPCHSSAADGGVGLAGHELADISNLFGETFARELMVYPAVEQQAPHPSPRIQEGKEDDISNLFGDTLARELLVYPAPERPGLHSNGARVD